MLFEPIGPGGVLCAFDWHMNRSGWTVCGALLIVVLTGCPTQRTPADKKISVEMTAPDMLHAPSDDRPRSDAMELPITVRLRNHGEQAIHLTVPTPCTVFNWSVVTTEQKVVQSEPKRACAQMVTTDTLEPAQQIELSHKILLAPRKYIFDSRYRLVYTFWGYPGHHDFRISKPH